MWGFLKSQTHWVTELLSEKRFRRFILQNKASGMWKKVLGWYKIEATNIYKRLLNTVDLLFNLAGKYTNYTYTVYVYLLVPYNMHVCELSKHLQTWGTIAYWVNPSWLVNKVCVLWSIKVLANSQSTTALQLIVLTLHA